MTTRDIVVVGTSAGGLKALTELVSQLPASFPAAVFIVQHMAGDMPSLLDQVLNRHASLPVSKAYDQETIQPGRIYVAEADHHLFLDGPTVRVVRGPRENRFRPSVDVLFRSAAVAFGPRVIGVVLTGMLDDGASGLFAIKQVGGIAVVQDPVEAEYPSMPLNAMRAVKVDHNVGMDKMGDLLVSLVVETNGRPAAAAPSERMMKEVDIAKGKDSLIRTLEIGEKTSLTCPECHGALVELHDGEIARYRCHTGHAYGLNSLIDDLTEGVESALWQCLAKMDECEILMHRVTPQFQKTGQQDAAALIHERLDLSRRQAGLIRQALMLAKNGDGSNASDERTTDPDKHAKRSGNV